MNERQLLKLKEEIEGAGRDAQRLGGQLDSLMDSLRKIGYDTIKSAEVALEELEDKISDQETEFNAAVRKVETQYDAL